MKGFVYILQSDNGRYYVGSTSDLKRRVRQHKSGHTYTTRRMSNVILVFSQEFSHIKEARIVEKKIKSWKRKDFIEKIIKDGFIKISAEKKK